MFNMSDKDASLFEIIETTSSHALSSHPMGMSKSLLPTFLTHDSEF